MKDKWRDYRRYTDQQLDDLLKGFAGQADYAEGVFEYQRRQNARREAESRAGHEKTQRLARWAMVFAALVQLELFWGWFKIAAIRLLPLHLIPKPALRLP